MIGFLEALGGVVDEPDLEVRRLGRTAAIMATIGAVVASSLAGIYLYLDSWPDVVASLLCAAGAPLGLAAWRIKHSLHVLIHFIEGWYLLTLIAAAIFTQGLAYIAWISVLPVVAFFVGGLRIGAVWATLSLLAVLLTCVVLPLIPFEWGAHGTPLVRMLRVASLPPTMAVLGLLFELARAKTASEMEAARVAALLASEAKGRLLAKVSHEIRTPLNGVLGLTQSLLLQNLPTRAHEDLQLIQRSGTGLLALINDLLDIARAEAGRMELHLGPVEVGRLMHEVAGLHRPTAERKGFELLVAEAPAHPLWVVTDEVRLRQVLNNLVSNAVKFTDRGHVRLKLVQGRTAGGMRELSFIVEDSGRGLPPEAVAGLFQPFSQFHPDSPTSGSGLGLAISKELASRLGGHLSAQSSLGHGSTFTLLLVLELSGPPAHVAALDPFDAFRALVVDDNALNRRVARALLEKLGATVLEASDGDGALAMVQSHDFDVVFMDLQMPGKDGLETTVLLRATDVSTPIVGLTASAGPDTVAQCRQVGMNGCLSKPVQLAALHTELSLVLSKKSPVDRQTG
jgi:signal transduction histidine kinase/ActR/RegA family two-component response regulator